MLLLRLLVEVLTEGNSIEVLGVVSGVDGVLESGLSCSSKCVWFRANVPVEQVVGAVIAALEDVGIPAKFQGVEVVSLAPGGASSKSGIAALIAGIDLQSLRLVDCSMVDWVGARMSGMYPIMFLRCIPVAEGLFAQLFRRTNGQFLAVTPREFIIELARHHPVSEQEAREIADAVLGEEHVSPATLHTSRMPPILVTKSEVHHTPKNPHHLTGSGGALRDDLR